MQIKLDEDKRTGKYVLIKNCNKNSCKEGVTYDEGIQALKKLGMKRPLTSKETTEAFVDDFNTIYDEDGNKRTIESRLGLIYRPDVLGTRDTSTAIWYNAKNYKIKIIPQAAYLLWLGEYLSNKNSLIWEAHFQGKSNLFDGYEITRKEGDNFNEILSKKQALNHPGWRAIVEEDINLLKNYLEILDRNFHITFNLKQQMWVPGFSKIWKPVEDDTFAPIYFSDGSACGNIDNAAVYGKFGFGDHVFIGRCKK